jgi:hypothetical protein
MGAGGSGAMVDLAWKPNWNESRQNFIDWWRREGLVIGMWTMPIAPGPRADQPHEPAERPARLSPGSQAFYSDAAERARRNHYHLSRGAYPADLLPISDTMIGPGSLALCLGSEPKFAESTVWFRPTMQDHPEPERLPELSFDPENRWWKVHEATLRECAELARGRYLVGCPDLIENIDILASLRGTSTLLVDLVDRPDWVRQKLAEINRAFFEVYQRIYQLIQLEDGSSAFEAYKLWGPGKTAKVQCDTAAMISPKMFREITLPFLREQCDWLDCSMYHLDGSEQFCHLEALLEIEALDAIEWTPNWNLPLGGDPRWYDLYRRILEAGKSVQVYLVLPRQIVPLLDAIGGKGVYILGIFQDQAQLESVLKSVEQFR